MVRVLFSLALISSPVAMANGDGTTPEPAQPIRKLSFAAKLLSKQKNLYCAAITSLIRKAAGQFRSTESNAITSLRELISVAEMKWQLRKQTPAVRPVLYDFSSGEKTFKKLSARVAAFQGALALLEGKSLGDKMIRPKGIMSLEIVGEEEIRQFFQDLDFEQGSVPRLLNEKARAETIVPPLNLEARQANLQRVERSDPELWESLALSNQDIFLLSRIPKHLVWAFGSWVNFIFSRGMYTSSKATLVSIAELMEKGAALDFFSAHWRTVPALGFVFAGAAYLCLQNAGWVTFFTARHLSSLKLIGIFPLWSTLNPWREKLKSSFEFSEDERDFLYFGSNAWISRGLVPALNDPSSLASMPPNPVFHQFRENHYQHALRANELFPFRPTKHLRLPLNYILSFFTGKPTAKEKQDLTYVTFDFWIRRTSEDDPTPKLTVLVQDFGDQPQKRKKKAPAFDRLSEWAKSFQFLPNLAPAKQ